MSLSPTQLGEAAYGAYRYRMRRNLERHGKTCRLPPWGQLAPLTKDAWVAAALEVVAVTRPAHESLREAALAGTIVVRVAVEKPR